MIEFTRLERELEVRINSELLEKSVYLLHYDCKDEYYAELLMMHFKKLFNEKYCQIGQWHDMIRKIRKQAYNNGYKDGRKKVRQKKYFNGRLETVDDGAL